MDIEIGPVTLTENKYGALNRAATQAKNVGDWPQAIALLREAKAHQGDLYQDTRLAKFLAHAGHEDEALQEIQYLLDKSTAWAQAMHSQQPASVRLRQRTLWQLRIHADAASICRWIGRPDKKVEHEHQRDALLDLLEKIDPVAEADEARGRPKNR